MLKEVSLEERKKKLGDLNKQSEEDYNKPGECFKCG
jgi:hypothetical protein